MRWFFLIVLGGCVSNTVVRPEVAVPETSDSEVTEVAEAGAPPRSSCLRAIRGSAEEQRRAVETLIARGTQCADAYAWLGALQRRAGEYDEAARNLRRALSIRSDDADVLVELALVHYARDEHELARLATHHAIQLDPRHAPAHNLLGLLALKRGDVNEAIRLFERASELDRQLVEGWMNLGQVSLSVRGYEAAEQAFERVVALDGDSYDAHIGLGVARRGLGNLDGAEASYRRAIAIADERPEAHFNLGVLYQDHRATTPDTLLAAHGHFDAYLERAPDDATRENVTRRCTGRRACRPGRLQLLEQVADVLTP